MQKNDVHLNCKKSMGIDLPTEKMHVNECFWFHFLVGLPLTRNIFEWRGLFAVSVGATIKIILWSIFGCLHVTYIHTYSSLSFFFVNHHRHCKQKKTLNFSLRHVKHLRWLKKWRYLLKKYNRFFWRRLTYVIKSCIKFCKFYQ